MICDLCWHPHFQDKAVFLFAISRSWFNFTFQYIFTIDFFEGNKRGQIYFKLVLCLFV